MYVPGYTVNTNEYTLYVRVYIDRYTVYIHACIMYVPGYTVNTNEYTVYVSVYIDGYTVYIHMHVPCMYLDIPWIQMNIPYM